MTKTRKSLDERIAALKEREKQTQARLADLVSRQKAQDRKLETRRKVVIGAAVLAHAEHDPAFAAALRQALRAGVTRETDKKLLADWLGDQRPVAATPTTSKPVERTTPPVQTVTAPQAAQTSTAGTIQSPSGGSSSKTWRGLI